MKKVVTLFLILSFSLLLMAANAAAQATRRKKLKPTPTLMTNQKVIKVRKYYRKGNPVRAHTRIYTNHE